MKWSFPSNNNGDVNGIGNSGVETFQGAPLKSLAREICQNSLDASNSVKPVNIEFMPFELDKADFPDADSLMDAFKRSLAFWDIKKAKDFFNEAIYVMGRDTIPFLRISDFNTTGLTGSDGEYNTPWCNLTKSSGASDKAGSAGGSFGIGKFAPFACSSFRTVFYSTLDEEGKSAYQGISRITSFRDAAGDITTGVGYYGADGNSPVFDQLFLEHGFRRDAGQTGTDVYIAGFRKSPDWKSDIVAAVLDGFLYAVYTGKLVVRVDDIIIDSSHLASLCEDYKEFFSENADKYYEILTSTESIDIDFNNMGLIRLWIAIRPDRPDMHRKVAMVRKTGMKIMDKGGISGNVPFAGLMLIEGDRINDFLRGLENPQHTKWEPDRCSKGRPYAQGIIRDLVKFIKDTLDKLQPEDDGDEVDPSVGEYLPDEADDAAPIGDQAEETITNTVKTVERAKTRPRKPSGTVSPDGDESEIDDDNGEPTDSDDGSGAGHNGGHGGGNHSGDGDGHGNGTGPHPGEKRKSLVGIKPLKKRVVCLDKEKGEYSVTFIPAVSAENGCVELFMSAESQNYDAEITAVRGLGQSGLTTDGNRIQGIVFEEKKPVRLRVTIDYHDYCSMEVKAYGNKI